MGKPFACPTCGGQLQRAIEVYRGVDPTTGLPDLRTKINSIDQVRAVECSKCYLVIGSDQLSGMQAVATAGMQLSAAVPCFYCDNHPAHIGDCQQCAGEGMQIVSVLMDAVFSENTFPNVARSIIAHLREHGHPYPPRPA